MASKLCPKCGNEFELDQRYLVFRCRGCCFDVPTRVYYNGDLALTVSDPRPPSILARCIVCGKESGGKNVCVNCNEVTPYDRLMDKYKELVGKDIKIAG